MNEKQEDEIFFLRAKKSAAIFLSINIVLSAAIIIINPIDGKSGMMSAFSLIPFYMIVIAAAFSAIACIKMLVSKSIDKGINLHFRLCCYINSLAFILMYADINEIIYVVLRRPVGTTAVLEAAYIALIMVFSLLSCLYGRNKRVKTRKKGI